ncbi:MAG: recombination protein O N-terminal domain-containing protein [bacterium]|nr:recombination protein O N-terminal domain-containing protein [bacterium]
MVEHYTKAVVLDKEDYGDLDSRVILYSEDLGRINAKVKSSRKITSKLAGHLEPGKFVQARVIELGGFQVVDALSCGSIPGSARNLASLRLIRDMTVERDPDPELWSLLEKEKLGVGEILACLGFAPQFASCRTCEDGRPTHFLIKELEYSCLDCLARAGRPFSFVL